MKKESEEILSYLNNRVDELKSRGSKSLDRMIRIRDRFILAIKADEYFNETA